MPGGILLDGKLDWREFAWWEFTWQENESAGNCQAGIGIGGNLTGGKMNWLEFDWWENELAGI